MSWLKWLGKNYILQCNFYRTHELIYLSSHHRLASISSIIILVIAIGIRRYQTLFLPPQFIHSYIITPKLGVGHPLPQSLILPDSKDEGKYK